MAKRLTDIKKWRDPWFRGLTEKAKLAWTYLNDECDCAGIWRADYGLATYQLAFKVDAEKLREWFGERVHFFGDDLLITTFFREQYETSSDSWSAKVSAQKRLSKLGFEIDENGKILLPQYPHSTPTVGVHSVGVISNVSVNVKSNLEEGGCGGKHELPELCRLWNEHSGDLPKVRETSATRNRHIRARLKEAPLEEWVEIIKRLAKSEFCNGKGPTGWKASFDFLVKPETRIKTLEGMYDNRTNKKPPSPVEVSGAVLAAVRKHSVYRGEDARADLGEDLWEKIKRVGGWSRVCQMSPQELSFAFKGVG